MTVTHAVVLAGGLGTRIRDALGETPKALADIAGVPFIDRKLDELARNGIKKATLLLGHASDPIEAHVARRRQGPDVDVILDGPSLLGTGGALVNALAGLPAAFYLTYGDSLLDMPYGALDEARDRAAVPCALAVTEDIGPADRPNCQLENGLVISHSKEVDASMTATDYGVMLLTNDDVRDAVQQDELPLDLSRILGELAVRGLLAAAVTSEPYWEIGTPESLARVCRHFSTSI